MYADMICDVMPPIPEDVGGSIHLTHHGDTGLDANDEAQANIEQLMVSMLDERDRVSETRDVLPSSRTTRLPVVSYPNGSVPPNRP